MRWEGLLSYPPLGFIFKTASWVISRHRLPKLSGKIIVNGIKSPVEVLRDKWGIPHIFSQNNHDLLFTQGFCHAQERLWQMDFTRRAVHGRLAEILGRDALPMDRELRIIGLYKIARTEALETNGKLKELLKAYCDGVNAWIKIAIKHKRLPLEFMLLNYQPDYWHLSDSFAVTKIMSWILAGNWKTELYRFLLSEQVGKEKLIEFEEIIHQTKPGVVDRDWLHNTANKNDPLNRSSLSGLGDGLGSNNWAVHGRRTKTGKPLLANDMHLGLTVPGIWYENHLDGGEFNVTGVSMPGFPLIVSGHNQQVAWGYTNSCADVQDLYQEHLRRTEDGSRQYEFKGVWNPVTVRREEIYIKDAEPVIEEVIITGHGPVINSLFAHVFPDLPPLALRWTAFDVDNNFRALYNINLAHDCEELHSALCDFNNPSENVVYADIHGDIGYTLNGRIPIRNKGDGCCPVPGWTGEYEWLGMIPFTDLPHLVNPECGYAATANNEIRFPDSNYFFGKDSFLEDRVARIREMIESAEKIDLAFIKTMQYDQVSFSGRQFAGVLGSLQVKDPDLQAVILHLRTWEGKLDQDCSLASVVEVTLRIALQTIIAHHLDALGLRACGQGPYAGKWPARFWAWFINLLEQPESPWFDLGLSETRDDILRKSLRQAVDYLTAEFGPDMNQWKWGRLHQLTFSHQLGGKQPLDRIFNLGPFPIGGDATTICAFHAFLDFKNLNTKYGPPFRFIADLNDLDHCYGMLVPGQSGHLASRHYKDGIKDWLTGEYHPMLFKREAIEENLEKYLMIMPEG